MTWFPAPDLQQKPLRPESELHLHLSHASLLGVELWIWSGDSSPFGSIGREPRSALGTSYLFLCKSSQPAKVRAVSRHMGWVQWQQVRSCPSFAWLSGSTWEQGGWRAPSLQTLAMHCMSYKNVLAGAQTAREGNVCPRHGSSPCPGQDRAFIQLTMGTKSTGTTEFCDSVSPHGCPCATWGVPEQGHGLLTPRGASLMSSLQMWQGVIVIESEASQRQAQWSWEHKVGPDCKCHVQMFAKIRKWRSDCALLYFVKLLHHKEWHRDPTQDRAYQGLVLGNQQ